MLSASNSPRWNDQPHDRLGQHQQERRGRQQHEEDLAQADGERAAHAAMSSRAASREIVGNSTVEIATLKTPWGSR